MVNENEINQLSQQVNIKKENLEQVINTLQKHGFQLQKLNLHLNDDIQNLYILGLGDSSFVLNGINNNTGEKVAIKVFYTDQISFNQIKDLQNSFNKIKKSQFVVNIQGLYFLEDLNICIQISDLCKSSLQQELKDRSNRNQSFSYKDIINIMLSAINSLYEIHTCNIRHLNIKPSNIMITFEGNYKLIDFNLQNYKKNQNLQSIIINHKEAQLFFSPEQIQLIQDNKGIQHQISCASDIYSMGLSLFVLIEFESRQKKEEIFLSRNFVNSNELVQKDYLSIFTFLYYFMLQTIDYKRYSTVKLREKLIYYFDYCLQTGNETLRVQDILMQYEKENLEKDIRYAYLQLQLSQTDQLNKDSTGIKEAISIIDKFSSNPNLEKVAFFQEYSKIQTNNNEYYEALKNNEQQLQILQNFSIKNKLEISHQLSLIGISYYDIGKYRQSLQFLEQSNQILENLYGQSHPDFAENLGDMGFQYFKLNENQDSLVKTNQALEIRKSMLSYYHPLMAQSLRRVGSSYYGDGQYELCLKYFLQALEILEFVYQTNNQDLATCYDGIGIVYSDLYDYEKSLEYYLKASQIRQTIYPDGMHPNVARSLDNIGNGYSAINELQKALLYNQKALEIRLKLYPDRNHPSLGKSFNNVGTSYGDLKQFDKALTCYHIAQSINKRAHSGNHPEIQRTQSNIDTLKYYI